MTNPLDQDQALTFAFRSLGSSYERQEPPWPSETSFLPRETKPHAVVIGSGFGGLAAAIRLGVKGYRVTVLERLDQPGGRACVFRQDGFTFDAGPTIVTAPHLFAELWTLCGRDMAEDVDLRPVSPFYRVRFNDGTSFDYSGDAAAMREEVAKLSPGDVAGYEKFMARSEAIFKIGFEKLGHVHFGSWRDMARILPDMIRLGSFGTVAGLISRYVKDPRLRTLLSFHPLLIGGNPFSASSIYSLIAFLERRWGVHFAMGGTGSLVKGMVTLLESCGGVVRLETEVTEIMVRNGEATGVLLKTGEEIAADLVISNADSAWTYRHLVPAKHRRKWTNRRLEKSRYSMGLFVWYFGTRRQYPDVAHHTLLLGPRYRDLLKDIFSRKVLADDFSLYLHRPTATDSSLAPEGCDAFYVLSPVPNLDGETDWTQTAEPYRQAISNYLSDTVLPGLEAELISSRIMTPLDFEARLLAYKGAGFGLEPVLTQSAWFRPHNRSEELRNLYIVGAGTHPGAGLPGVLTSAKILDSLVPDARNFV